MAKKAKILGADWNFASLMNEGIRVLPEKPLQKRSGIWASEIGGDFASRYLRMHAHTPSNPPNERSRRKFISGHIFEWIVQLILTMCGVLKQKQLRGVVELPGCLPVSGKLDFVAGGHVVDWEKAKAEVEMLQRLFATAIGDMPPIVLHSLKYVIEHMEKMFTHVPLNEYILEVKSVSAFVSQLMERTKKPRPRHSYQILHYQMVNKLPGHLVYIDKDAFLCHQFEVLPTKSLIKEYKDDVLTMTGYFNASGKNYLKNIPPLSPEVIFYDDEFRFAQNTEVAYSNYLTMLYGYADWQAFQDQWQPKVVSWNRCFKRAVLEGQTIIRPGKKDLVMKLTDKNKIALDEMREQFPEVDKYIQKAKKLKVFNPNEPETENEEND